MSDALTKLNSFLYGKLDRSDKTLLVVINECPELLTLIETVYPFLAQADPEIFKALMVIAYLMGKEHTGKAQDGL
jgi:hypothetical protein